MPGSQVPINFKRHILAPLSGLIVFLVFIFVFNLQYILGLFYQTEVNVNAERDNSALELKAVDPNAQSKIIINSVSVEAPISYDQKVVDEERFQSALRNGVVHYPGTANPGEIGNVVIFGHSSNYVWAEGNYKDVFAPLHGMEVGQKIYIEYQGTRYIYSVQEIKTVEPDEVSVLQQTSKKELTLITCTPVGTNKQRLIVKASQVAPVYTQEEIKQSASKVPTELEALPSSSPSFWQNIKDLF